jgi:hypothetical protein
LTARIQKKNFFPKLFHQPLFLPLEPSQKLRLTGDDPLKCNFPAEAMTP